MTTIERLSTADFEEAMDFLNLVFGAVEPHDFERMLPLCYRPQEMHRNLAIREGGRIRAIVGLFERSLEVGAHTLRVGCIGGVSTHPRSRGRGYMRALMDRGPRDDAGRRARSVVAGRPAPSATVALATRSRALGSG